MRPAGHERGPRPLDLRIVLPRLCWPERGGHRCAEERFALTPREFDLIWLLMNSPDRFIPRAELLAAVWGKASEVATHTLAQHVHAVRKKLGLARRGIRLAAVYGSGYRIESPAG
jgi:DNA-binding response OmpR family regulator